MAILLDIKYKIVLVPFPYDDQINIKMRPALCLTEKISPYNHIVIAFITSNIAIANNESDLILNSSDNEFKSTGLKQSSAVILHRITTIPSYVIKRELGFLPLKYHKKLKEKLAKLFEL